MAATIGKISRGRIRLELTQSFPRPPFQPGERVRLRHWDEQALYYSDSEILALPGRGKETLVVSVPKATISLQRRAAVRFHQHIPLRFMVAGRALSEPDPGRALESQTCDVAIGGLSFETDLPLMEGDDLRLELQPCGADPIRMAAQVAAWHCGGPGTKHPVGVRFLRMGHREAQSLAQLLERCQSLV